MESKKAISLDLTRENRVVDASQLDNMLQYAGTPDTLYSELHGAILKLNGEDGQPVDWSLMTTVMTAARTFGPREKLTPRTILLTEQEIERRLIRENVARGLAAVASTLPRPDPDDSSAESTPTNDEANDPPTRRTLSEMIFERLLIRPPARN